MKSLPLIVGILGLIGSRAIAADAPSTRHNILFILTDDQRWDTIHALGNPQILTPNVDRLVEQGFHFNNVYCMGSMEGAVCLPSRTMIATGQSLWRIPPGRKPTCPPGTPMLPVAMKEAGYVTFHIGKAGNACTFSNRQFMTNIETKDGPKFRTPYDAKTHADAVIDFLGKHDGKQPFFIYLAPPVPHDPRLAPPEFQKMYDPARITLSKNFMPMHPWDNGELMGRDEKLAAHPRNPDEMRQHLADYYALCTYIDVQVGRILETLREKGFDKNTVVIFTSDQGLAVGGRHGLMGKQNLYEHVKPPLIFAGPGIPKGQSDALVYLFDLFPTFCDMAGTRPPAAVEGQSLLPIITGKQPKVRDALLGAYKASQRMVRDQRWKLLKYNADGVKNTQLFDLSNDPDELHNLAGEPRNSDQLARMEKLLAQERQKWGDPCDFDGKGTMPAQYLPQKPPAAAK